MNPWATTSAMDAVHWLRRMPSESADMILTDHAYESLEKHRKKGTTTRLSHSKSSSNDWFTIFPDARLPELMAEAYRVLKKNSHMYMFSDFDTMFVLRPIAEQYGFKCWKAVVWDKQAMGMGYHYRGQIEYVLFFEKGKRRLNSLSVTDLQSFKRIRAGYPTEKPSELMEVFVKMSTNPGDTVIDPFMGSGSSGVASIRNGCNYKGNDLSLTARAKAVRAIREEWHIHYERSST